MTIGQNDTSSAYRVSIVASVHLYCRYDGTPHLRNGLPQGASFTQLDASDHSFLFHWENSLGFEGQWSVCFDLSDNVNIKSLCRCVTVLVQKCVRCVLDFDLGRFISNEQMKSTSTL